MAARPVAHRLHASYAEVRGELLSTFVTTYSRALQEDPVPHGQGRRGHDAGHLEDRFLAPNKDHVLVDFSGFDVDGVGEERRRCSSPPTGLRAIERTVLREGRDSRPAPGPALRLPVGPRWADEVRRRAVRATGRRRGPADDAARALTDEELDQALSGHPRIGERGGAQSEREQAGVDPAAGDTERGWRRQRGVRGAVRRAFLIRAAGRDAEAILAELDRLLGNDDATERAETVDNLRQIALLRLDALV